MVIGKDRDATRVRRTRQFELDHRFLSDFEHHGMVFGFPISTHTNTKLILGKTL